MNEVEFNGLGVAKKVSVPSSWSELSTRQVRWIFREYDSCLLKSASPLEFNVRVLYYLLGVRLTLKGALYDVVFKGKPGQRDENVYLMCERLLKFLFSEIQDDKGVVALTFDALENPLPWVRVGWRRLIGPSALLQDLTFGEFRHAADALNAFFRSKKIGDISECIAILYRPRSRHPNRAGRAVEPASPSLLERDSARAARLPSWQKSLIMMWFSSCLHYLQTGEITINGERVRMAEMFSSDAEDLSAPGFNWNDLLVEIAKEQSIGNISQVDDESLYTVISIMWHNFKERKRYESITKAH